MDNMHQSRDNKGMPITSFKSGKGYEIRNDVFYYTNQIVNIVMIGKPGERNWILVDAGMPNSTDEILKVSKERFGEHNLPAAIVLTHGHFDHVGNIVDLIREWHVPVFAHPLEFPYLTGERSYPEPDTSVEGGMLAKLSSIYPIEPINIKRVLQPVEFNFTVTGLNEWKWIHTPGHSPGHMSLFRESDKTLIVGDAFVTVKQDSLYKVLTQKAEVHGPPVYLTTDWKTAWDSVKKLEALKPDVVVTGHGPSMRGEELKKELYTLAKEFDKVAIPDHGRYVNQEFKERK
jgi:glyoxylase-like metal-dependent hydrolase (beta-lactamase superfamily II)